MKIVLKKPVITEKAISRTKDRYYTFEVDKRANKHEVKETIQRLLKVNVVSIHTQTRPGTQRRAGKLRRPIIGSSTKRAIVQIAEGQSIDLFTIPTDDKADKKEKAEVKETKKIK